MNSSRRRVAAILLAISLAGGVAACSTSDDDSRTESSDPDTGTESSDPDTEVPSHSDDPDVALVRIGSADDMPSIVIGGDGWAYMPAPEPMGMAPAPPKPTPMIRRQLDAAGVDTVLLEADRLGLLSDPGEYDFPEITDSSSTTVTFDVGDGMIEHNAYALGIDEETGARARLWSFVAEIGDLEEMVGGANIGPAEDWTPTRYVVSEGYAGLRAGDVEDRAWPATVPVEFGCVTLPLDSFPDGAAGGFVAEVDGTQTVLQVVPDLPGDACS